MKLTRMRPARWAVSAAIALALLLGLVALANGRRPAANRGASAFMWLRPESRPRGLERRRNAVGGGARLPTRVARDPHGPGDGLGGSGRRSPRVLRGSERDTAEW